MNIDSAKQSNRRATWRLAGLIVTATALLGAAGCGDDGDGGVNDAKAGVTVTDVWARTSPMMATAGAAYMIIESDAGDSLLSASVDPSVAARVEVHETVMSEMPVDSSMPMGSGMPTGSDMPSGEMMMRPVERIDIGAGTSVALAPGGYHLMILDLAAPLEVGSTFDVVLTFEKAGAVTVRAEVREEAP